MNNINIIKPYKWEGEFWVFDDESKGLDKEPLVEGADTLLDLLVDNDQCKIMFSETNFPSSEFHIDFVKPNLVDGEENGNYYHSPKHKHDLWLCPALFKYFENAPKRIFIKLF